MTNAEKYEEVFGVEPGITVCPNKDCLGCSHMQYGCSEFWWGREYKEPTKRRIFSVL